MLYEYLKKESVPIELAIKLAGLEIRRKYPQLNHKAAKLIASAIEDDTFKTLFPEKVLLQFKLRDLRRQAGMQNHPLSPHPGGGVKNYHPQMGVG